MRGEKTLSITTLIVLFIGLALTVGMWQITSNVIYLRQKIRFDGEVNDIVRLMELKTKLYESSLRSLRAAFVANKESFNLITFKQYVDDISPSLPTFAGFAFYRRVEAHELKTYQNLIQSNLGYFDSHYKNFNVTPIVPNQPNLMIAEYIFPFEDNKVAIGKNVLSNKQRRTAIEYAIQYDFAITNQVNLTKKIPKAILLYMPVFDSAKTQHLNMKLQNNRTISNLYGIIGCGFELEKLMNTLLSDYHDRMFIRITDIDKITHEKTEIFNSNPQLKWNKFNQESEASLYQYYIYEFGGRQWFIEFKASENYIQPIFFFVPPIVATLGILITLLVFGLVANKNKLIETNTKLKESEDRFEGIVDTAPLGLVISSVETGKILLANQQALEIFGVASDEDLAQLNNVEYYIHLDDLKILVDCLLRNKVMKDVEFQLKRRNQELFWALISARLVSYHGEISILAGINDITQRKAMEEQLRQFATIDSLTNINNRRHFLELSNQELHRAIRFKHAISVMMLDIDKFKNINDTYGHDIGDIAIKLMTKTCSEMIREFDIIGRLGGEEFAIILPETDRTVAEKIAERIRVAIEHAIIEIPEKNIKFSYTTSIGFTTLVPDDNDDFTEEIAIDFLLSIADNALYQAKNNGRNRVEYRSIVGKI